MWLMLLNSIFMRFIVCIGCPSLLFRTKIHVFLATFGDVCGSWLIQSLILVLPIIPKRMGKLRWSIVRQGICLVGDHLKSLDYKVDQAEFAYNRSPSRSMGLSHFHITYGFNPRAPVDLALTPDLKRINGKAKDMISNMQEMHKVTE